MNIDFYELGKKHAEDSIHEIEAQAELIKNKYGAKQCNTFLVGAAAYMDAYFSSIGKNVEDQVDLDTDIEKHVRNHM